MKLLKVGSRRYVCPYRFSVKGVFVWDTLSMNVFTRSPPWPSSLDVPSLSMYLSLPFLRCDSESTSHQSILVHSSRPRIWGYGLKRVYNPLTRVLNRSSTGFLTSCHIVGSVIGSSKDNRYPLKTTSYVHTQRPKIVDVVDYHSHHRTNFFFRPTL